MTMVMLKDNIQQAKQDNSTKKPPSNLEAEQFVLGSFLNDNNSVNKVADILLPEHFFLPIHQSIYKLILKFMDRGLVATPLTVKSYLEQDKAFNDSSINCFDYLIKLVSDAQLIIDVYSLAVTIHDLYIRRQLIEIGQEIVINSYEDNIEYSSYDRLERAEQKLFNLATQGNTESNFTSLGSSLSSSLVRVESIIKGDKKTSGISTNFQEMDNITGGLHGSDLIIVAARPSMGKTSFAVNIALNVAIDFKSSKYEEEDNNHSVAIFSLEMSSEQIANRILSIRSGIDSSRIRTGSINSQEFSLLSHETNKIAQLPLFIDDSAALSISAIRTRARRLKRQHNLGLIVIDYLQLIRPSGSSKYDSRVQEIGEISQGLKALAKELNIPVIALSQLSRAVESREDKRPQLSDLRESGNIEQDADLVAFLYREEYYLRRKMPVAEEENIKWQTELNNVRNIAEIIISKQRNGPIGSFWLHFNSATTGFSNFFHDKV